MNERDLKGVLRAEKIIRKAYSDARLNPANPYSRGSDTRLFIVTYAWLAYGEGLAGSDELWPRIGESMGINNYRLWEIIRNDLPRYVPPPRENNCVAPKKRAPGNCGKSGARAVRITEPATGRWRHVAYCRDHDYLALAAEAADKALRENGAVPQPAPNTGGILPCHLRFNWPDVYKQADERWEPPELGVCADDWPVMKQVKKAEPPRLVVIEGEGGPTPVFFGGVKESIPELTVADEDGATAPATTDRPAPALRLIRSPDEDDEQGMEYGDAGDTKDQE